MKDTELVVSDLPISSTKMDNRIGDSTHPWGLPVDDVIQSVVLICDMTLCVLLQR